MFNMSTTSHQCLCPTCECPLQTMFSSHSSSLRTQHNCIEALKDKVGALQGSLKQLQREKTGEMKKVKTLEDELEHVHSENREHITALAERRKQIDHYKNFVQQSDQDKELFQD